jgi:hypothetical protein
VLLQHNKEGDNNVVVVAFLFLLQRNKEGDNSVVVVAFFPCLFVGQRRRRW